MRIARAIIKIYAELGNNQWYVRYLREGEVFVMLFARVQQDRQAAQYSGFVLRHHYRILNICRGAKLLVLL